MQLVFASRNRDKIAELSHALEGLPLEVREAADFPWVPDVEETGATLEENALLKVRAVHAATHALCLADDTGLEVDALDGAPGVHSARFAGPDQSYEKNLEKLIRLLEGCPAARRTARFRTVVAIAFPDGREETADGVCEGLILDHRQGTGGFGYDPVFYHPESGKTFAEMGLKEKGKVSHRGLAMARAREILARWLAESA